MISQGAVFRKGPARFAIDSGLRPLLVLIRISQLSGLTLWSMVPGSCPTRVRAGKKISNDLLAAQKVECLIHLYLPVSASIEGSQ